MALTLKQVNKALEKIGAEERLFKGDGYFYFGDGQADTWKSTMVYVYSLNSLTLAEWIEEYKDFKESNEIKK